jgi:hypothetical protein
MIGLKRFIRARQNFHPYVAMKQPEQELALANLSGKPDA